MPPDPWFVYILKCADDSLYTGIARDPKKRLEQHSAGQGSRFVRSHLPAQIAYQESISGRSSALKREAEIKRWSPSEKRAFIARKRCPWPGEDSLMVAYHDREWGKPLYDDQKLFEFLILEGMQAGLSWRCVLHKREHFRRAFAEFDPEKVARFGKSKIAALLKDAGIIRNRLKIESAVTNAQAFLKIKTKQGAFYPYIWKFVGGKPIVNHWKTLKDLPARTEESDRMSREMKKDGFRFVGSTICYAHMQATGMVNDHLVDCFRHSTV